MSACPASWTTLQGEIDSRRNPFTFRLPVKTAYTLDDMAQDALGLMDALKLLRAHVVGVSMGGMIAQLIAIHHPARMLSLTRSCPTAATRCCLRRVCEYACA